MAVAENNKKNDENLSRYFVERKAQVKMCRNLYMNLYFNKNQTLK